MQLRRDIRRVAGSLALAGLILTPLASAQSASEEFFEAYYLEQEQGDLKAALAMYERVAESSRASADLRRQARRRGQGVAEQLASSDFARLVPEDTIFYLEFNRPGEQLANLLGQLGLLSGDSGEAAFGISPLLIDGLFGMRGAAVAVTHVDPTGGPPNGVVILDPGDLDVVRGLIETAVPIGGKPVQSIRDYATYNIEGHMYVTLTSRLVIASPDRGQIEGVIERMRRDGRGSLAANEDLAGTLAMRGEDLFFFCINLKPVMPMIMNVIRAETHGDPEVAAALAFFDLESTRSIAGRVGVDRDGISLDLGLELDEGHNNLAFNLMRMPNIDADTLSMIPAGVAFFCAGALNDSGPIPPGATNAEGEPVITFMDFGREFFANISELAFYAMPEVSQTPFGPMPEIALAVRTNDPARSRALWNFVVGIAQAATSGSSEVIATRARNVSMERYEIHGVPVIIATHGNDLIVSPSENAILASIAARRDGRTVLQDAAFSGALEYFREGSTRAAALNLGRCTQIASHFMSERERREMMPFAQMLTDTSAAISFQQTSNRLGLSARICGIPNVAPVVSQLVAQQMGRGGGGGQGGVWQGGGVASREVAGLAALGYAGAEPQKKASFEKPKEKAKDKAKERPKPDTTVAATSEELLETFRKLNAQGHRKEALHLAKEIYGLTKRDANSLNTFAWRLLTEKEYGNHYDELAFEMSTTSNELSDWGNWYYLDTFAHALFQKGEIDKAIDIQKKAIEIGKKQGDERVGEAEETLKRFEKAAKGKGIIRTPE